MYRAWNREKKIGRGLQGSSMAVRRQSAGTKSRSAVCGSRVGIWVTSGLRGSREGTILETGTATGDKLNPQDVDAL
jgi:hypothetical protein